MFARRFYANSVSRFCFAASLMHAAEDNFMQGDHCSGKPVNVGEFDSRMSVKTAHCLLQVWGHSSVY